jgi:hypothetical protein
LAACRPGRSLELPVSVASPGRGGGRKDPYNEVPGKGESLVFDGSGRVRAARSIEIWLVGAIALALAPLLGGCASESAHSTVGATVAFESIDGPPRPVFDRLVARLDAEARVRRVAVVSRRASARYRIRAYLAAKLEPRRTTIVWVWDVYDSDLRRAIRIFGEEPAGARRPQAWAAADERVLARIAEAGMTQLAAFAAGPGAIPPDGLPTRPGAAPGPADPPADPPAEDIRVAVAAAPGMP